jgi:hypothetical protein
MLTQNLCSCYFIMPCYDQWSSVGRNFLNSHLGFIFVLLFVQLYVCYTPCGEQSTATFVNYICPDHFMPQSGCLPFFDLFVYAHARTHAHTHSVVLLQLSLFKIYYNLWIKRKEVWLVWLGNGYWYLLWIGIVHAWFQKRDIPFHTHIHGVDVSVWFTTSLRLMWSLSLKNQEYVLL